MLPPRCSPAFTLAALAGGVLAPAVREPLLGALHGALDMAGVAGPEEEEAALDAMGTLAQVAAAASLLTADPVILQVRVGWAGGGVGVPTLGHRPMVSHGTHAPLSTSTC